MAHRLLTLGTLAVLDESGRPLDFPHGKPLALLIRLLVGPEPPTRRDLVHLLWSRSTPERGLQSVRQALWLIRKALGEDVLESNETVRLAPGALTSDVSDLERALEQGRITDAAALWRGAFLHRFAVADAPEWDRWVDSVHEDLSRRLANAVFSDAQRHRDAGDVAGARRAMERAVEIAPFEPRYREELVTFLLELRDLRAAEKALAEARQTVEVPEQRSALERLSLRVEELRADRATVPDERFARPDLVGRSAELADLMALWRRTEKGGKRIVLLTGPAGIGKTRLADELARTLQHENAATVTVRAAEAEQAMEYGVIASLTRALLQLTGAAGISTASDTLLRGLAPSLPVRGLPDDDPIRRDPVNPAGLSDALADLIGAVAWERPLLVTVDDAGWADASSIAVFARALRTLREGPVMVVLTARTSSGVAGMLRPLESIEGGVAFSTIRLRPLSRPETHELVALLVSLPESTGVQRLLDRIHATTGGNPFYVIELIRAFLDERLVAADGGHLVLDLSRLDGAAPWPKNVRALVRRRFERLTAPARALGHLIATVTPREPETAARRLAGLGRRAYAMAVGELIEHGIVAWDGTALVFTHAELREAAAAWVEEGPTARRRRWPSGRIVAALAIVGAATVVIFRVAGLRTRSGEAAPPPWGGGEIVIGSGDSILVLRPVREGDRIRWDSSTPPFDAPGLDRLHVFRTASGETIWLRESELPDRGPDIYRVDPATGAQTPIVRRPGDDNIGGVSPDGNWLLYRSDNPATDYDPGSHIARIDGSEPRLLSETRAGSGWSPDGRYLGALALAPVDTLFVLTPAGHVVAQRTGYRIANITFCGPDDRILFSDWTDEGPRLVWWRWTAGNESVLGSNVTRVIACSPDGTAAFVGLVQDRTERTGILEFENGAFHDLALAEVSNGRIAPTWLADRRPPVPSTLTLDFDSVYVNWGGADSLSGRVTLTDGTTDSASIVWSSADSSIATVSASGVLLGNQPGSTVVRGCVDDWICDSVRVAVTGESTKNQIVEDRFDGVLDTAKWIPFGQPIPRIVNAPDDERVLFLNGDGVWIDGILGRDTFTLNHGVTLELEFRYRTGLHRTDRQTAMFCLVRYDLPEPHPAELGTLDDERIRQQACFSYPSDQRRRFDPEMAYLSIWPSATGDFVRDPRDLPPLDWTHLAIQVRPDGRVSLILNHRQVAELRIRLTGTVFDDWRIELAGHSLDTHLEVRNVALWSGPRY